MRSGAHRHLVTKSLLSMAIVLALVIGLACSPKATPTPTRTQATPTPTAPATATATPTSPAPTATSAPQTTPTATATLPPGVTPSPTATSAPKPSPTATPSPTPTATPIPEAQAVRGGMLKQRAKRDPNTWDPGRTSSADDVYSIALVTNNLLWWRYNTNTVECELCQTWEVSADAKVHTFKLRQGVKFQSGTELDAEVIKYNFDKWMGKIDGFQSPRTGTISVYVDHIEVPDKYTVKVYMKQPAPAFAQFISSDYASIIEPGLDATTMKTKPSGTGPYILDRQFPGSLLIFKRNPNYFKPGLPYLDELQEVVLTDPALGPALVAGQVDYSYTSRFSPDITASIQGLVKQGKMYFATEPHNWMQTFTMNNNAGPTKDKLVRQAIDLAIDRTAFNDTVLYGRGVPRLMFGGASFKWLEGMQYAGVTLSKPDDIWKLPGWDPAKKEADRQKARELLAQAGYTASNPLKLKANVQTLPRPSSEYFTADLKKVGIQVDLNVVGEVFDDIMTKHNYEAAEQNYLTITGDPDELLGGYFMEGGARAWTDYRNPEFDKLFAQQSAEPDFDKRKAIVQQMVKMLLDDAAMSYLPYSPDEYAWWSYFKGFNPPQVTRDQNYRHDNIWDGRKAK